MNRRLFFGMSAASLIAAGLPLTLMPERSIILPPRGGWWSGIRMREIEQYLINIDSYALRYDAAWKKNGALHQYHVDAKWHARGEREKARELARSIFESVADYHSLSRQVALPLHRSVPSCYV